MPSFDGGIITERIGEGGLIPTRPDFNRRIPERVLDSGRIFRAIDGLEDVLQTKGSGASPELVRTEMGLIYGYDLEAVLARQLITQNAEAVDLAAGAANTTVSTIFSVPTDHLIEAVSVEATVNPANVEGIELLAAPFGDPNSSRFFWATQADVVTSVLANFIELHAQLAQPWFMRAATDYTLRLRSNAGGAATVRLRWMETRLAEGTGIPSR